MIFNFTS